VVDDEKSRRGAYRLRSAIPGQRRLEAATPEMTAPETTTPGGSPITAPAAGDAGRRPRRRVRFAHAVRRVPPGRAALGAGRAVRAWSRRPAGRVALPAVLLLIVVAATGATGALVVPAAIRSPRPVAAEPPGPATASAPVAGITTGPALPAPTAPPPTTGGTTPPTGGTANRPVDALAGWASQTSTRIRSSGNAQIPVVALQAYGYAELVLSRTKPSCGLSWTTLAAIGKVESDHGSANGSTLQPDGRVQPPIIGLPLDGKGGRQRVADTDGGQFDGDRQYDRALGPMQFIPSTWRTSGVDADNDGQSDPQDINDAALAAGNYLCANGRNLSIVEDWWAAILSYNEVQPYAQRVYDTANQYGAASRT
jgi:membrane-bound lytic murein transglycosylase B